MKFFMILWVTNIAILVKAQNLVPDSSFEIKNNCPSGYSEIGLRYLTKYWYTPTNGTSDYFNSCSSSKSAGVPNNLLGTRASKTGHGYVGLYLLSKSKPFYREYIETKLMSTLIKDSFYCVKLFVSRPTYITTTADQFGVYFSNRKVKQSIETPLKKIPQVNFNPDQLLSVGGDWQCLNQTYKAIGGEEYITIGNFVDYKSTRVKKFETPKKFRNQYMQYNGEVYYYIDDVSLIPIRSNSECGCNDSKERDSVERKIELIIDSDFVAKNYNVVDSLILGNVSFETSSWELQRTELKLLDNFVVKLQGNPLQIVDILGHTDSLGIESKNIELSIKRAKAVFDYLIENGISEHRINYSGYGSAFPLDSNLNEEGRMHNRRVEIRVYQKIN